MGRPHKRLKVTGRKSCLSRLMQPLESRNNNNSNTSYWCEGRHWLTEGSFHYICQFLFYASVLFYYVRPFEWRKHVPVYTCKDCSCNYSLVLRVTTFWRRRKLIHFGVFTVVQSIWIKGFLKKYLSWVCGPGLLLIIINIKIQCADTHRASHLMFFGLWWHLLRNEFDRPLDLPPWSLRAIR